MARVTGLPAIVMSALMLSTVLMACAPTALGQGVHLKPTLQISSLNPQSREVTVTPSSIGSATFSASVSVSKPPAVGTVMVTLDASCSTGWPTVVSPASIPFTSGGSVQISVTVVVPQATPTSSIGKVLVNGLGTYPGTNTNPATAAATVTITQYFRIQPQSLQSFVTIGPGGQAVLSLDLYNRGNGLDTIDIEISNLKDLSKKNWMVTASAYEVSNVVQDEYQTIKLQVKSEKPTILSYKRSEITYIQLNVKSSNAGIMGLTEIKTYMFAVVVDGWGVPGFDVTFLIMAFGMVASALAYRKKKKKFG
jgi:hypothetical protein